MASGPEISGTDASSFGISSSAPSERRRWGVMALLEAYASLSFNRPYLVMASVFAALLALSVGVVLSGKLVPSDISGYQWLILGEWEVTKQDAFEAAAAMVDYGGSSAIPARTERSEAASLMLVYHSKSGTIFSQENLSLIKHVEDAILSHPAYPSFCQLSQDGRCLEPLSPLASSDAGGLGLAPPWPGQREAGDHRHGDVLGADEVREALRGAEGRRYELGFFLDRDFSADGGAHYTRTLVRLGLPLEGYDNPEEEEEDQEEAIRVGIVEDVEGELMDWLGMRKPFLGSEYMAEARVPGSDDLEVMWFNEVLFQEEFGRMAYVDFFWAGFSVLAVFAYMIFHTRSLLIASVGMAMNVLVFPVAFFFFYFVLRVVYFDPMMFLMMFIVLGIGADDVFVFTDAFKQSYFELETSSVEERLKYTMRRSAKAIFVTSFTTLSAFLATSTSPIMPVSAFGIFAGIMIFLLYIENVLLMPATLAIYDRWSSTSPRPRHLRRLLGRIPALFRRPFPSARVSASEAPPPLPSGAPSPFDLPETRQEGEAAEAVREGPKRDLRWIERLFRDRWVPLCNRGKWPILTAFSALLVLGLVYMLQLAPPEEEDVWFPRSHIMQRGLDLVSSSSGVFSASDEDDAQPLLMVWGLKGMETSSLGTWQVEDRGDLVLDDTFDPADKAAQKHLLDACGVARAWPCEASGCSFGMLVRHGQTSCAYEGWQEHLARKYPDDESKRLGSLDREAFWEELDDFIAVPETLWTYNNQLGMIPDEETGETTLKYVMFEITTTYVPPSSPEELRGVWRVTEALTDELNTVGPPSANKMFSYIPEAYRWMVTQKALVRGAIQGVALVFGLAIAVLIVATHNIWVSIMATVTVAGIVCSVMGVYTVAILGWSLGIAEAIAIVILIGFSMDYCLHLAGAYVESTKASRTERAREAISHMGISIAAGATTTLVASLFLFGATMQFFQKFAKLISVTVILAFLWSVAFFLCALLAFGPEGTSGDVHLWAAHLIKRAKMRHSSAGARRGRGGEGEDEERGEGAR